MFLRVGDCEPQVHETAHVARTAVLRGDVRIGAHSAILHGAVITADGGPVEIGADCVVMENAVVRGAPRHPASLGSAVLVGPHAHLTGCTIEDDVFVATGAAVFNGAVLGSAAEVRIHAVVHVNSVLAAGAMVPIGWIAVGNPARIFPPSGHEDLWPIQRSMQFSQTVWGAEADAPQGERIRRYARALSRRCDQEVDPG